MRAKFFNAHDRVFATIEELQAALDTWVGHYNTERPHQAVGMCSPVQRFQVRRAAGIPAVDNAGILDAATSGDEQTALTGHRPPRTAGVSRWVNQGGAIRLAGLRYRVGPAFAGEPVEAVCTDGLVQIFHAGVLVATHAQRLKADHAHGTAAGSAPPTACRLRRVPRFECLAHAPPQP
jgi:hypothetical protein